MLDFGRGSEEATRTKWRPEGESLARSERHVPVSPTHGDLPVEMMSPEEYKLHQLRVRGLLRAVEQGPSPGFERNEGHRRREEKFKIVPVPTRFEPADALPEHMVNRRVADGLLDAIESVEAKSSPLGPVEAAVKEAEDEWKRWNQRQQRQYWV
ncbi:uncharacterized protein MYCFIDRAFT_83861 [Pseudocercospora fijiensis CIRAD86]|uniref:Uncharacterized protein n=1 Tax=Pseudocercospora fijiensis (strain CIRAD86) TaxID=383855 RepID=M3ANV4_PSEFD|nr:uncharacterized protein MYCFIDRAFT_83861 [Pseudocercospora fijiensis CIRAD86]EME78783.1 hypothetical protein MYCFIDRAFT_83861 [Pseudocercospora fijiensis CIRAD86]